MRRSGYVTASATPAPPTPAPGPDRPAKDEPSIGALVSDASTHLSTLIHGEIELAKLELRSSIKNAGTGIGFFVAAAVLVLFSLVYGFQSLAEGIAALGVYRWLAFLIVFAFQLLLAGLLAFLGIKKVKRVKAPERTMKTTKETVDYLKKSRG
jgi:Putative Actinobacterial Holin-X, holin superfamily III